MRTCRHGKAYQVTHTDRHAAHSGLLQLPFARCCTQAKGLPQHHCSSEPPPQSELHEWMLDDRRPEGCRLESCDDLMSWIVLIEGPESAAGMRSIYQGQTFRCMLLPPMQCCQAWPAQHCAGADLQICCASCCCIRCASRVALCIHAQLAVFCAGCASTSPTATRSVRQSSFSSRPHR